MMFSSIAPTPQQLLCFGASGTGSQVAFDVPQQAESDIEFIGYVDDFQDPRRRVEPGARVFSFEEMLGIDNVGVLVAVHDPVGRRKIFDRLIQHDIPIFGSRGFPQFVHPLATIGMGSYVSSSSKLAHSTRLGVGVVGLADLIGHDVTVGDFTTLAYGSTILGHVEIGNGVFVGAGAIITNGSIDRPLTIGDGATIGSGAVVDADVLPGETVLGPRAQPLRQFVRAARQECISRD